MMFGNLQSMSNGNGTASTTGSAYSYLTLSNDRRHPLAVRAGRNHMLIEHTLFGVVDKVALAIERLKAFEPPEGYYLAFSGGKDSVCIYQLAKMAGVKFDAHFNNTTCEAPETIAFIKEHYSDVEWHRPVKSIWQLIEAKGAPTRMSRFCCEKLKEYGGEKRTVVIGVRRAESFKRSGRQIVEQCKKLHKTLVSPIVDWTDDDVWQFIRDNGFSYCSLYDEGFTRIGCVGCPMGSEREREFQRWPNFKAAWIHAFQRCVDKRNQTRCFRFKNGQEFFDWWMEYNKSDKDAPDQTIMFE